MSSARPAFVYFDLGNVLVHFDPGIACRNMAELCGLSPEEVRRIVYESELETAYERGEVDCTGFHAAFCRHAGVRVGRAQLRHAAADMFQVNTSLLPLLGRLRAAGFRLGVLSNTCPAHWEHCAREFPFLVADFEVHALSYRLRALKPEPRIYLHAAKLAGVLPREVFFVDDREENVDGARQAGFDALQFVDAGTLTAALEARGLRPTRTLAG